MNRVLLSNPRLLRTFGNVAGDLETIMERLWGESEEGSGQTVFAPRLDIAETEQTYEVTVDLPGVKADDVRVEMHEDRLTIAGVRHSHSEQKDRQFHRVERSTGSFSRTVVVPSKVEAEKIAATYSEGVLHVTLPKASANQPRRIKVEAVEKETARECSGGGSCHQS